MRSVIICTLFLFTMSCTRDTSSGSLTLTLEVAPSDIVLSGGEKRELQALAKTNSPLPISYVWEKLQGEAATKVSDKDTYMLGADTSPFQCAPAAETYRVIATAGSLRAEKTFSVKAECGLAPLAGKANDTLTISPEQALLSPSEKLKVLATTGLKGATLKWERVVDGQKVLLSSNGIYVFEAPELDSPCQIKTFALIATVMHGNAEETKTMSVKVQNKTCSLSDITTITATQRILNVSDDIVFIGTKTFDGPKGENTYASVDVKNQTYFGGDGGIFVFKDGKQRARFDGSQWGGKSGLFGIASNRSVRALTADASGSIWVGLQASVFEKGGLLSFKPSADGLTGKWMGPTKLPQGQDVRALATDSGNNLWIATDNGLVRRNTAGVFKTYGTNDGLPSTNIRDVALHAESGNLWIATSAGVVRWSLPLMKF